MSINIHHDTKYDPGIITAILLSEFNGAIPIPADSVNPQHREAVLKSLTAPSEAQNIALWKAIVLASTLNKVPIFQDVEVAINPTNREGNSQVNLWPLDDAFLVGIQLDDKVNAVLLVGPNHRECNAALVAQSFSLGWRNGISSLLAEIGLDGNNAVKYLMDMPAVADAVNVSVVEELSGIINVPPPPTYDPFAQPTGLHPSQLPENRADRKGAEGGDSDHEFQP